MDVEWPDFVDGELEDIQDETDEMPFEAMDGFIEFPAAWQRVSERIAERCTEVGLVGSFLATEEGFESELLTVLLKDLNVEASFEMRGWLLINLERSIREAVQMEPLTKRLRGDGRAPSVQRIQDATAHFLTTSTPGSSSSSSDFIPFKGTRRVPGLQRRMDVEGKDRARLEQEDLEKQQAIMVKWLMEVPMLPSVEMAFRTSDPLRTLSGLCGKTRSSTIKTYLKRWGRFREWLLRSSGSPWPSVQEQLVDYFYILLDEPVGASVPQATWQAMSWMESTAGLRDEAKLSACPLVAQTLKFIVSQLGTGAAPTKQAPRLPVIILAALELYLRDTRIGIMFRIHCGGLLFRAWATLRFDDVQHLDLDRLRKVADMLVTELFRTKTSGAGKRNKELPVAVWVDVHILDLEWVSYWLQLLRSVQVGPRDHLLQKFSNDGVTPIHKMMKHAESTAVTQIVLLGLKVPFWQADGGWSSSAQGLLSPIWTSFWSEHSPRSVLPSIAAVLVPEKDLRNMLGRWAPSGSEDYCRTYRVVVTNIQKQCCAAIKQGLCNTTIMEDDIIDRAVRFFAEKRGLTVEAANETASAFHRLMQSFNHQLSQAHLHDLESSSQVIIDSTETVLGPEELEGVRKAADFKVKEGKFMIVYSRDRRHARLHKVKGGCYWSTLSLLDYIVVEHLTPSLYDSRCKHCWPTVGVEESDSGSSTDESN